MDYKSEALKVHEKLKGKLDVKSKMSLNSKDDLSIAYTPGVAEPCKKIHENSDDVYKYTMKGNCVAVISDGSAVLGLGNIGARASIPVMEGKAQLFKELANINAFPICLEKQDINLTIETVKNIAPIFGGINLEDFKAPECFEIEKALQNLGIPVMHDDQHGTAVVVLAALINSLKIVNKKIDEIKVVVNGSGAAGIAITKLLLSSNVKGENLIVCDSKGIIHSERTDLSNNPYKKELALQTNTKKVTGNLENAIINANVFIGVSVKNIVSENMVKSMASEPVIMALANPDPEILPLNAKNAGAKVYASGRSDFSNQVNNALAFPGIFRGALDAKATKITEKMKVAASYAIASLIENPTQEEILPNVLDERVVNTVSNAVKKAWEEN